MAEIPLQQLLPLRLGLSSKQVAEFCQRWQIDEFALFESVLRSDFRSNSDIDILISYCPEASHGLLARVRMKYKLEALCGREVDLVTKKSVEQSQNVWRRQSILESAQVIYVA